MDCTSSALLMRAIITLFRALDRGGRRGGTSHGEGGEGRGFLGSMSRVSGRRTSKRHHRKLDKLETKRSGWIILKMPPSSRGGQAAGWGQLDHGYNPRVQPYALTEAYNYVGCNGNWIGHFKRMHLLSKLVYFPHFPPYGNCIVKPVLVVITCKERKKINK